MTPNRSLALSTHFRDMMRMDLLSVLEEEFPFDAVAAFLARDSKPRRDRVYSQEATLLAMVMSAVQEDKSLQHAVNIFSEVHERNSRLLKARVETQPVRKRGRPPKGTASGRRERVAKSKLKGISADASGFSQARLRLDPGLVDAVFEASGDFACSHVSPWHGMEVYMTDGTYIETQDTPQLRASYDVKDAAGRSVTPYPQVLLQGVVKQSTGAVTDVAVGSRHVSELALAWPMVDRLPEGSLLLADDLYNSYAFFAVVLAGARHMIVPGKRMRKAKVVHRIASGDEIITLTRTRHPDWLPPEVSLPETLTLRRITTTRGDLYTTLTDASLPAADIVAVYLTRWDIEITIREIKTLMELDIARSKTPEMVLKEIKVALTAYNLVRRAMAKATQPSGFPPETDLIQAFYEVDATLLRDKKNRVYARWSPGRHGRTRSENASARDSTPAE